MSKAKVNKPTPEPRDTEPAITGRKPFVVVELNNVDGPLKLESFCRFDKFECTFLASFSTMHEARAYRDGFGDGNGTKMPIIVHFDPKAKSMRLIQ